MTHIARIFWSGTAGALVLSALGAGRARGDEPVRNGNEMALHLVRRRGPQREALVRERTGLLHTFRYLHVVAQTNDAGRPERCILTTREPSSDAWVHLCVSGSFSRRLAAELKEGEAVAAKGRVATIETNVMPPTITVDPAVLLHRDRPRPKAGLELLHEVDSRAH